MPRGGTPCGAWAKRQPNPVGHAPGNRGKDAAPAVVGKPGLDPGRGSRRVSAGWRGGRDALEVPDPSAHHAAGLVDAADDKHELLGADPTTVMDDAPQDAEDFELEVEILEERKLAPGGQVQGAHRQLQRVQCCLVEPLAEREALALGQVGRPGQRPAQQLGEGGLDGRLCRGFQGSHAA